MTRSSLLLSIAASVALSACTTTTSTTPDPTSTGTGSANETATSEATTELVQADTEARESDDSGRVPGPTLPEGEACESDADCDAEQVCEGIGCGPKQGRCTPRDRMCTRDLATYCGCDGKEFQGSGSCPGGRYAYRGPCQPALELGEACTSGAQCRSGLCAGEGLEGCGGGAQGVCSEAGCTKDLATYCGCNGFEFEGSGSCPNQQFAYRGPCEPATSN